MAGTNITIDLDDAELRRTMAKLSAALADSTPAMRDLGERLLRSTRERFSQGQKRAPDGTPWARNRPSTIERKGRDNPLYKSGLLQGTLRYQVGAGGREVLVGSNRIYAAVQQFGNPQNRMYNTPAGNPAPIPARPFLGVSADDRQAVLRILQRHLSRALER